MKYKAWFLENEGLPYLIYEGDLKHRVDWEIEKFKRRITNTEIVPYWIWIEENNEKRFV